MSRIEKIAKSNDRSFCFDNAFVHLADPLDITQSSPTGSRAHPAPHRRGLLVITKFDPQPESRALKLGKICTGMQDMFSPRLLVRLCPFRQHLAVLSFASAEEAREAIAALHGLRHHGLQGRGAGTR